MTTQVPDSIRNRYASLLARVGTRESAACETAMETMRARWPGLAPDTNDPDISTSATWMDAVEDIVEHWTRAGRCFSAGEIAKVIRDDRRDLRFNVPALTRFVSSIPISYAVGDHAVEVNRITVGKHRTPAGLTVVVYAPTRRLGLAHDFEVEIPRPGPRALGTSRNATAVATVHGS